VTDDVVTDEMLKAREDLIDALVSRRHADRAVLEALGHEEFLRLCKCIQHSGGS
jgi:hypothetical protein